MNLYFESQVQADHQFITSHFNPYFSQRMWDEIQVYAVPDSFVSAPRFVRLCPQIRSSPPPDSLTGLEFGISQWLPCSWGGVGRLGKLPFVFVRYVISRCSELVYIELSYYFVPTVVLKKERSGLRD